MLSPPPTTPVRTKLICAFVSGLCIVSCESAIEPIDELPFELQAHATSHRASDPDLAWYNGVEYYLLFPSANSRNENQFMFGCFNLGPDQSAKERSSVGTLYAVLLPGASQDSCPDGSVVHDHVVSAVPDVPGYSPFWAPVFVLPGPQFDPSIMPLRSEAEILAAVDAAHVVLAPLGFVVHATIAGRTGT